jgi:hypothetical protein
MPRIIAAFAVGIGVGLAYHMNHAAPPAVATASRDDAPVRSAAPVVAQTSAQTEPSVLKAQAARVALQPAAQPALVPPTIDDAADSADSNAGALPAPPRAEARDDGAGRPVVAAGASEPVSRPADPEIAAAAPSVEAAPPVAAADVPMPRARPVASITPQTAAAAAPPRATSRQAEARRQPAASRGRLSRDLEEEGLRYVGTRVMRDGSRLPVYRRVESPPRRWGLFGSRFGSRYDDDELMD